jgi:ankyrin repeat protein
MAVPADWLRALRTGDVPEVTRVVSAQPRLARTYLDIEREHGTEQWMPLHVATEAEQTDVVRALLDAGVQPDSRTRFPSSPTQARATALHLAAAGGHPEVARVLIEAGASSHVQDARGQAPLHLAAAANDPAMIDRLLEAGAAVDPADLQQRTPLHTAIAAGAADAAIRLIDRGADVTHRCPREPGRVTPLDRCGLADPPMPELENRLSAAMKNPS